MAIGFIVAIGGYFAEAFALRWLCGDCTDPNRSWNEGMR
jgi:hypothetical protein